MDCPSEEQMMRMKLEVYDQVKYLNLDIPNRKLGVNHTSGLQKVHEAIS